MHRHCWIGYTDWEHEGEFRSSGRFVLAPTTIATIARASDKHPTTPTSLPVRHVSSTMTRAVLAKRTLGQERLGATEHEKTGDVR